ncbi:MAG: hypothetical protein V4857_10545 [Pseudomonadota bacterium]
MNSKPDIVVYSHDQNLLLVVEIKGTPKSDAYWAAKVRRNLAVHAAVPAAPYFLLVVSDHLYLWENEISTEAVLPNYVAETRTVLQKYLPKWKKIQNGPVRESGLELAVRSWLSELTTVDGSAQLDDGANAWLEGSGLQEKIRTGEVRAECQI